MISATAPGKVILFGEHAVVYGRPALAAPITHLRARATIEPTGKPDVALIAPDLNRLAWLSNVHPHNPLAAVVRVVERHFGCSLSDGYSLSVTSAIPIASGLGSGAAISVAVIRALVRSRPGGGTFHIEDVQDHVELGLMRGGHHEIARAYVLYREKRTQERARKQEEAAP